MYGSAMEWQRCSSQLERKVAAPVPNATILHQPKSYAQGQATNIQIELGVLCEQVTMLDILSPTQVSPEN